MTWRVDAEVVLANIAAIVFVFSPFLPVDCLPENQRLSTRNGGIYRSMKKRTRSRAREKAQALKMHPSLPL
jgi:hypothetical protein